MKLTTEQYVGRLGEYAARYLHRYQLQVEAEGKLFKAGWIADGLADYQRTGDVAALMHLASDAAAGVFGHIWQKADTDTWASAGHDAAEHGNRGPDGRLEDTIVEYKVAQLSVTRRWMFNSLADWRGGVVNVALGLRIDEPVADWTMFVGTTPELRKIVRRLEELNPSRRAGKLGKIGDKMYLSVSKKEIDRYAGWVDGIITVDEWVDRRNRCGF